MKTPHTPTNTASPTAPSLMTVRAMPADLEPIVELPSSEAVPAGMAVLYHPQASDYIFLVDPTQWEIDIDMDRQWDFLAHKTLPGCRLDIVPPMGPPAPERVYYIPIGPRNWVISEYSETAIYHFRDLYLFLDNYNAADCNQAQTAILANLMTRQEYAGEPAGHYPTATQRPGLPFSECPDTLPTYLRPGDQVYLIADSLRLRSDPDTAEGRIIKTFQQFAPYYVNLLDGVRCDEEHVFRQVELCLLAEGSECYTGWMAESDGQEYFLALWDPGW